MWHYFYQNIECCGFIYVINVMESQIGRIHEAKKWLHILLNEAHLFNTVAMVIFNVQNTMCSIIYLYIERGGRISGIPRIFRIYFGCG